MLSAKYLAVHAAHRQHARLPLDTSHDRPPLYTAELFVPLLGEAELAAHHRLERRVEVGCGNRISARATQGRGRSAQHPRMRRSRSTGISAMNMSLSVVKTSLASSFSCWACTFTHQIRRLRISSPRRLRTLGSLLMSSLGFSASLRTLARAES